MALLPCAHTITLKANIARVVAVQPYCGAVYDELNLYF
jgi:hypothetical protein